MTGITTQIIDKLLLLPGLLIGLSAHEFAHAYAAYKLGDDSQRLQGRLTLNPIKHIDPMGFLLLMVMGFGWAKPVMVNSRHFKNPRRDDSLVSVAGPLANLLLAIIFTIFAGIAVLVIAKVGYNQTAEIIMEIINRAIMINLVLMVFNLIPIPPLDGHHILGNIVGAPLWNIYYKYADYWRFVLIGLIVFRGTSYIISPVVGSLYSILINTMQRIIMLIL
jgi:Zn-dependent protease